MRPKLIACEVLYREVCDAVARSSEIVDVEFLPKGLHDMGGKAMSVKLQEAVQRVPEHQYEAILLGYGLCGNGLHGIEARHTPVVAPRMHDCIGLLMGGRQRYESYFQEHPGTYFRSTGWLERGVDLQQLMPFHSGENTNLAELVEKYGEDNGRYLYEQLTSFQSAYRCLTFIETGIEHDGHFEEQARQEAKSKGWKFEKLRGNLALIHRLGNRDWSDEDFVVLRPGQRIVARFDSDIIRAESIEPPASRQT
ncbi:MAG: DUF1638 domain-containing protein [Candidatus Korobacteraceae bacterium]|jgi:hypothetical protein